VRGTVVWMGWESRGFLNFKKTAHSSLQLIISIRMHSLCPAKEDTVRARDLTISQSAK